MLDSVDSGRPEHCCALIAHELSHLNIAALSEVRLQEEGSLREHGAGYTLFWSGHSDCIISLRLPLHNKQHVVLFSIYAPTLQADPAEKDKFYTDLRRLTQKMPADDKIIILGDFNTRVGKNSEAWKGILGKHGVRNCNDNGRLLLEFCAEQQLTITIFQQKNSLKTTWMHPRSKHWHLIDYVLVRRRDVRDVHHTRVMPSAECQTDHRLVCCKLNFNLKFKPKRGSIPRRRL
ncbi:craniofacial development protein 2-like [Manacus candei]|uniref:craniofacial development protein 2-like n=1 Tax=Manacus candei TaxID=415023 RepID=UPI002226A4BF|nr:craniofacial development protein 2-like [Manacus candei]